MKIITSNPIEFKKIGKYSNCDCDGKSSGIDGSNNTSVREFQVWASMNHGAQLAADGIYGPLTQSAYKKWGAEWELTQPKASPVVSATKKPSKTLSADEKKFAKEFSDGAKVSPETKPESIFTKDKPTKLMDKLKALPMPAKIGIGIAVAAVLGIVVWKLLPKK